MAQEDTWHSKIQQLGETPKPKEQEPPKGSGVQSTQAETEPTSAVSAESLKTKLGNWDPASNEDPGWFSSSEAGDRSLVKIIASGPDRCGPCCCERGALW